MGTPPGGPVRGPVPGPTPGQTLGVTLMVTPANLTASGPTELASLRTGQDLPETRKGRGTSDLHGGKTMIVVQQKADRAVAKARKGARIHALALMIEALTATANEAMDGAAEDARNCANRCFTRRQPCPAH